MSAVEASGYLKEVEELLQEVPPSHLVMFEKVKFKKTFLTGLRSPVCQK